MGISSEQAKIVGKLGGRPKGKKNKATLDREKVQAAVRAQILKMADKLIRSQAITAIGTHKVVVMSKDADGAPVVETIRNIKKIDELFATGVYGKDYLIVAASEPDWKAADALLNRGLGKATEHVDHTSGGEPIKGFNYIPPSEEK